MRGFSRLFFELIADPAISGLMRGLEPIAKASRRARASVRMCVYLFKLHATAQSSPAVLFSLSYILAFVPLSRKSLMRRVKGDTHSPLPPGACVYVS